MDFRVRLHAFRKFGDETQINTGETFLVPPPRPCTLHPAPYTLNPER